MSRRCRPMPARRLRSSTRVFQPRLNSSSTLPRTASALLPPTSSRLASPHDTTDADAAFMRDSQVPINMSAFATKLDDAAWRSKPSWAVIATDDKAFDQAYVASMAKRIGAKITEVAASHAVFMTQPRVVADVIDEAARKGSVEAR